MTMPTHAFEEDGRPPKIETLAIAEIKQDHEIAAREIDPLIVAEYAEQMTDGDVFPPVKVTSDGAVNYLTDGWRRGQQQARSAKRVSVAKSVRVIAAPRYWTHRHKRAAWGAPQRRGQAARGAQVAQRSRVVALVGS